MELNSFTEDIKNRGLQPGQQIISFGGAIPPARVVKALELPKDTEILCVVRVRLADSKPIGIQTSYVVFPDGGSITKEELEVEGSLNTLLQNEF